MAVNKIIYNGTTLIDLTGDTVSKNSLLNGVTAHNKSGGIITGTVVISNYRYGTSEPDNSLGDDGDWYLITEG